MMDFSPTRITSYLQVHLPVLFYGFCFLVLGLHVWVSSFFWIRFVLLGLYGCIFFCRYRGMVFIFCCMRGGMLVIGV